MKQPGSFFGARPDRIDRLVARVLDDSEAAEPRGPSSPYGVLEQPGSQIDRYKLLEVLGEGGMGVVYLAEQNHPVRRQVALKILKPGMDSRPVLARFEAEQRALALMEHPHIARVYDAGLAPSGRPYFVMEHVRGIPITKHCDRHRLTVEERLRLYLHVCEAVQHAHQKGIIHRDLKPSNILVADGPEAVPKVIDFGIARAIGEPLTERTFSTEQGHLLGTPEYMSPEQADTTYQDIDTRTDVYSLGVVLYELLAGVLPFDAQSLRTGGIAQVRKVICEQEPKTPSTRLGGASLEQSTESAMCRHTDLRTLKRKLSGDLDWITLKALEKDRSRRYSTVDSLAVDIRNYLDHQPISAALPRVLYRVRKFAHRHRQATAVATAIVMLLFALVWGLLAHLQTIRERHERILAQAQRLFEARDLQTRDISDPSNAALAMIQPLLTSRHVGRKAQLLFAGVLVEHAYYSEAVPRLQRLLNGPPEIAGTAYALLARILWENSSLDPEDLRKIETYQKKAETLGPGTAEAYYLRAMAALTIREKLDFLEQALRLDRGHYPSRRLRALIFQASRKYGELRDEAVVIADRWPSDPLGSSLRAIALKELGDYQEAVGCYDTAIRLTSPQDPQYINLNEQRCAVLMRMGRYNLALEETRRCLEMATNAIVLQSHIFCALTALGRYEEAIALYQRLIKSDTAAIAQFKNRSMKHVFEMLEAGLAWHPLDNQPEGPAFLSMLEAEEVFHRLSAKAHRLTTDCFSGPWSPDGKKMALTLGLPGNSGVAIYDPATKETDLLIVPGKDASWSPNGQRIAFVRDCEVLRLSELTTGTERRGDHIYYRSEEVWVMNADGTQPRRLARGAGFPSWSRDSKHVYYQSRMEHMLCSISIEEPQAKPVPVFPCCAYHPSVSPDDKWVAHIHQEGEPGSPRTGVLKITDLASRSPVAEWAAPVTMSGGYWSPDGRELALLGGLSGTVSTGLWIYDVDKREAAKVLSGPIVHASWAPDRTQLLIRLGIPYHEIWVADLDPSLSTTEVLGPARTLEEHCRECIATCNRQLEADPNHRINHLERTACALWIDDDQARTYLKELDTAFDRMPRPVADYQNAQQILSCPPLRDHLMSLALVLARKASIHPHCARDLCHMLYRLGRYEQAAFLWPKIADSIPGGTCRYDEGSDSYTMVASGHDLFGTLDDLHFAGKKLQGDGSITARIDSIENVNEWTSAGIMIRSTLEPDCPGVLLVVTPAGRLYYRHRLAENEVSYSVDMPTNTVRLPHWLQLIRQGNHFMALHSSDGITWEDVLFGSDQQSVIQIPMGETVYVGLAANSRDFLKTAEARISHVTTTGHAIPAGPFKESRDIRFQLPVP